MSSKQEPAQVPSTVVQAEPAPPPPPAPQQQPQFQPHPHLQPHFPVATNTQQFQGQVIYQTYGPGPGPGPGPVHFHQGPPVWNQPPPPTIHYVQYHPPAEKLGYNHFGTVHFAQPMENGEVLIRGPPPQQFIPQQYITSPQWYPAGQPPPGQFIPTYATNFNVSNDPAYNPNHLMNRGFRDDFQGAPDNPLGYMQFVPFVAPIGVMESQAHASASYTANWVSSTSSIPPEMKDEPESDNISQYEGQRPLSQLNGDNWSERDEHFSPSTAHQHSNPDLPPPMYSPNQAPQHMEKHSYTESRKSKGATATATAATTSTMSAVKNSKSDRSDEKRELTFDERLEKARMQKDRVEMEGDESPNTTSAAQGSIISAPPAMNHPRSNGQRKEYKSERNEGSNTSRAPRNSQNGSGEQSRPYRERNNGNGNNGERDRQPKRENNYSSRNNENTQNDQSYNQNVQQYQQPNYQQNQNQNQFQPAPGAEHYRISPNYRGNNPRIRGGYNSSNRGHFVPRGYRHQGPVPSQGGPGGPGGPGPYMPPPLDPQMYATMNAFQNTHIGPPGPGAVPLLPGPFGLQRHPFQQDVKFRNTWLDANSFPIPLTAVLNYDGVRGFHHPNGPMNNGSFRGAPRGRGGYGYRGGYRGGNNNGNVMPRYSQQPVQHVQSGQSVQNENGGEVEENKKEEEVSKAPVLSKSITDETAKPVEKPTTKSSADTSKDTKA